MKTFQEIIDLLEASSVDRIKASFDRSLQEASESDHVKASFDYMPDHNNKSVLHKEIGSYAKKHGGSSVKVTHMTHDGPGGGASEVHVKGKVHHVMKLINHHHDENYSHDHAGHKQYQKDYE